MEENVEKEGDLKAQVRVGEPLFSWLILLSPSMKTCLFATEGLDKFL